jgi:hypothetical protein
MATRMQQRRSLAADWTTANPILAAGEIGFETDTNKFKIGDGVNHWADLVYFTSASEIQNIIDGAPDLLNTLNELAAAIGDDADFITTITGNIASAVSDHSADTTNVHGIADTSALATKAYADSSASSAEQNAKNYADNLSSNYDADGAAASALDDANTYTDNSITAEVENRTAAIGAAFTSANEYTDTAIANLVDSAPSTLNTLNELSAALGDDANYATTITTALGTKANLSGATFTGDIDLGSHNVKFGNTTSIKNDELLGLIVTADLVQLPQAVNFGTQSASQMAVAAIVAAINDGLDLTLDGGTL